MISQKEEYKNLIIHRLDENWKSFKILFELKHYGNCISIMCQELDQVIKIMFLLNSKKSEKDQFISSSINNQKWFRIGRNEKKEYITDDELLKFTEKLNGWEKSIYNFGFSFESLSNNYNYLLKNPIISLEETERFKIYSYIKEYHSKDFPIDFTMDILIPLLPLVFMKITSELKIELERI